jgi:hypothetical protein
LLFTCFLLNFIGRYNGLWRNHLKPLCMHKKITPIFSLHSRRLSGMALLCGALFCGVSGTAQTTRFVKPQATGTADGSSWENASNDIQAMINSSIAGDFIWVAGGTYKPNRKANDTSVITPADKDNAYVLKQGVALYGNFAGTEALLAERDITLTANASILSGDFNNDDEFLFDIDTLSLTNNTENAYHVLVGAAPADMPITTATVLDGFTITGGNAHDVAFTTLTVNGQSVPRYLGGGLINRSNASPTVSNVIFTHNAAEYGGAVYNRNLSAAVFTNVTITQNMATFGGGVTNWIDGNAVFNNVVISNNTASAGGGMYNYQAMVQVNGGNIINNTATLGSGGGIFNNACPLVMADADIIGNYATTDGGGMYNTVNASVTISGGVFNGNQATNGGGMYNTGVLPTITNVVFNENIATANGGGIYNINAPSTLLNVEMLNNAAAGFGGGICNWTQSPGVFTGVNFANNTAENGAGIFSFDNSPTVFTGNTFTGNTATAYGGGAYNRTNTASVFTNCLFTDNAAENGGGMFNFDNASAILTNVTMTGNFATMYGGAIDNDNSSPLVRNSIVYGNTTTGNVNPNVFNFGGASPVFAYSIVEGSATGWGSLGTDGGNNLDANPQFADIAGSLYSLALESPAVNSGNSTYYTAGQTPNLSTIATDIAGNPRFYNSSPIDMGAYELQGVVGLPGFNQLQVTCYPNPVVNYVSVKSDTQITGAVVYNMLGQPTGATWNGTTHTIDMAGLQAGNYIIKITTGNADKSVLVVKK